MTQEFGATPDVERVRLAIARLRRSDRGQAALNRLGTWLSEDIDSLVGLDGPNQSALANVIMGLWGPHRGTVADMVRFSSVTPEQPLEFLGTSGIR